MHGVHTARAASSASRACHRPAPALDDGCLTSSPRTTRRHCHGARCCFGAGTGSTRAHQTAAGASPTGSPPPIPPLSRWNGRCVVCAACAACAVSAVFRVACAVCAQWKSEAAPAAVSPHHRHHLAAGHACQWRGCCPTPRARWRWACAVNPTSWRRWRVCRVPYNTVAVCLVHTANKEQTCCCRLLLMKKSSWRIA